MYEEDFKAAQMLSIALIHKYAVAGKAFQFDYFENTGIKIIDPWNDKLPTAEIIEVNCEGIFYTTFFDHTDFTLMQVKDGWSVNARLANGLCERPDTIYPNLQAVQKNEPAFDQLFNTFPKLLKKPINRTINIRRSI
jgi:hypothetical protein